MDREEAKLFLEKVKNILYDFDVHHISCDMNIFGGITMKEIICLASQLIHDHNFNEDDYELILDDWDTDEG